MQHKSVHFHCHDVKPEKFQEPEGMTTIDLKDVHALEEEHQEEVRRPAITRASVRKYIVKSLIIGAFVIFGMVTLLTIVPPQSIRTIAKSWRNILHLSKNTSHDISASELTKLISSYTEKIEHCKDTRSIGICCATLAELYEDFAIESCNIDTIRSLVDQFDGNTTKSGEQNFLSDRNGNITLDKYKYYNEQSADQFYYDENAFFESGMKISDVVEPVIEDGTLKLEGDDVAIILSNGRIVNTGRKFLKKREASFEPLYYYSKDQELDHPMEYWYYTQPKPILRDFEHHPNPTVFNQLLSPLEYHNTDINHQHRHPKDGYFPRPQLGSKEHSYRKYAQDPPQTFPESKERQFKFEKSKQPSQPTVANHERTESSPNPTNLAQTSTQCIPYTYTYDPSPRYAELLPMNRNPYLINPNYPYPINPMNSIHPSYFPVAPTPLQYQYNPFYAPQNTVGASIQATNPSGQFYICNPVPAPATNQLISIPGVEVRQRAGSSLQDRVDGISEPHSNKTRDSDLCPPGEVLCGDELKCVTEYKVCDNEVDCKDASDEVGCSCPSRVGPSRLCDGFYDCPNGEDEWDCFGCKNNTFSCDDWTDDRSTTCIPLEQRCDGIVQCRTGKDENDCSILSETFGKPLPTYKTSNSVGFLYKNYKGKWYPACSNSEAWATNACEKESGPTILSPITQMIPIHSMHKGQYINGLEDNEIDLVDSCVPNFAVYAQCPSPVCGKRIMGRYPYSEEVDDSNEDSVSRFRAKTSYKSVGEQVLGDRRVVGGSPSRPAAWPWVVSIYRNGFFHCGGVIITETWILTAAHCVDKFSKYYFEVEAGILRRLSYSPMQQTRFVTHVICHDAYDRAVLKNDLALVKINTPLRFNRYIRPICLPSEATAGKNYLNAPPVGTLCTAIGWGATFEHGPDPDHLREVELPVLERCKYPDDEDGNEICAGFIEGGKDACQGDSGGPFMCRNPNSLDQWYVAGIVSHGDGCARPNEPGVYTRVSLYLNWIFENIRSSLLPFNIPLLKCPGYECKATKKCLPKRSHCDKVVDCLLGDDERHCERSKLARLFEEAMRNMIMVGSALPLAEVNKSSAAEDTTQQTTVDTEGTTFITMGESPVAPATGADAISAFKIENSGEQTERALFATESGFFATAFAAETTTDNLWDKSNSDREQTLTASEVTTEFGTEDITTIVFKSTDAIIATPNKYFKCSRMLQLVPVSRRCDKFVDCEDGTDEMNCTCLEHLKSFYKQGICDGINDCADLSDEQDCGGTCTDGEFRCRVSSTCVEGWKKCDSIQDCPHNEDEWDCFALTDANALLLDRDLRPHLNTKGVVSFYHNQTWMPLCSDWTYEESAVASEVCFSLGLDGYVMYRQIEVEEGPLKVVKSSTEENVDTNQVNQNNSCNALYVRCSNRTVTPDRLQNVSSVASDLSSLAWNVAVYADGEYKCTGILLNLNWVLTSANCFHRISDIQLHYVTVLAGMGRSYMGVRGPHEQLRLVVHSTPVLYSDAVLLKTEKKFSFTRYVRPIHLPTMEDTLRTPQHCVAIGMSENYKMETVLLHLVKNCAPGSRCFKRILPSSERCNQRRPWSGVITCELKTSLHPIAIYHEPQGICGFSQSSPFTVLWLLSKEITDIMQNGSSLVFPPMCNGFRCPLGNCIESKRACDGMMDCRNGEDESERSCKGKIPIYKGYGCGELDLKCTNGRCVSRSTYCDRNNDCGDNSDEPSICSCYNYLNLTQPNKICDGVVNCEDKSDENPKMCGCSEEKFRCNAFDTCIPFEMICDGEQDCPSGEDETQCLSLRNQVQNAPTIEGEVILRTAGVWHSGCFPNNMSTTELSKVCNELGFGNRIGSYMETPNGSNAIPAPIFKGFDIVWIHITPKLRLALRSGREPLIQFSSSRSCFKLYIRCIENKS